jgi:hypothetical protein
MTRRSRSPSLATPQRQASQAQGSQEHIGLSHVVFELKKDPFYGVVRLR